MQNLRIMSKAHAACNSICCLFVWWLGAGSVLMKYMFCTHEVQQRIWSLPARQTQQSSWTQLNRFAKSSYPSLSNTSVFTRQLLWKSPPLKEEGGCLPAVTCTITFWGDSQEKEVLVPYLRVSQSLGMAPYVHWYTKYLFHFILFSPLYF